MKRENIVLAAMAMVLLAAILAPVAAPRLDETPDDECTSCHGGRQWFYIQISEWPKAVKAQSGFSLKVTIKASSNTDVSNLVVSLDMSGAKTCSMRQGEMASKSSSARISSGQTVSFTWNMQAGAACESLVRVNAKGDVHYDHNNPTTASDESVSYSTAGKITVGSSYVAGVVEKAPPASMLGYSALFLAVAFVFDPGTKRLHKRLGLNPGGYGKVAYYLMTLAALAASLLFIGGLALIQSQGRIGIPPLSSGTVAAVSWFSGFALLLTAGLGLYEFPVIKKLEAGFKERMHVMLSLLAVPLCTFAFLLLTGGSMVFVGWGLGRIVGIASLLTLILSMALGAPFGIGKTLMCRLFPGAERLRVHCLVSYAILSVALAHAMLLLVSYYRGQTTGLLDGGALVAGMVALGYLGIYHKEFIERYGHPTARWTHRLLSIGIFVGAIAHAIYNGTDFAFVRWW